MFQFLRGLIGDPGLKIIALIIGILLWFLASIERTYQLDIKTPTEIINPDTGYLLANLLPESITIRFEGKGSRLIPLRVQKPRIILNLKGRKSGYYDIHLTRHNLLPEPHPEVAANFSPRRIKVHLVRESSRNVDLWVPIAGIPNKDYAVCEVKNPNKVLIRAPQDLLVGVTQVSTETLSVEGEKSNIDTSLQVITQSPLIKATPESVPVTVVIEECGETTFSYLPIAIERKMDQLVMVSPERVTIRIKGPKSKVEALTQSQIEIKINVTRLNKGDFLLPAQISLPPGLDLISSNPKIFRVVIK
ncbi:MAG TPA: hypothetical protein EYP58_02570 [bacterium (Candidatus Stahlbacteria)]|nr:hypothetical protein [Candidatus Stahlbacteria bacterium]